MVDWLMFFRGDDYLTLIHLFKYLTFSVLVTQNKDPRNLGTENGLPESNVVKQFVFVCLFVYLLTYLFIFYLFIYLQTVLFNSRKCKIQDAWVVCFCWSGRCKRITTFNHSLPQIQSGTCKASTLALHQLVWRCGMCLIPGLPPCFEPVPFHYMLPFFWPTSLSLSLSAHIRAVVQ